MSENTKPGPEQEPQQNEKDEQELKDDQLDSVAGGVIEGGCIPPYWPPWKVPEPPCTLPVIDPVKLDIG
jgi:hypothetical protein